MRHSAASARLRLGLGLGLVLALGLGVSACAPAAAPPPDRIAALDGEAVTYPTFEAFLRRQVGEGAGGLDSEVLSHLLDQFLEEQLLLRLAREDGLVPPGAGPRDAVAALVATGDGEPSDAEIEGYFAAHADALALPERVWLRHLLVADRVLAERLQAEIAAGMPFAEAARRHSRDPTAEAGGDQGELAVSDLPEPFARLVGELEPGVVSPVVEAPDGFHLFLVEERLAAAPASLDAARGEVVERLRRERQEAALAEVARQAVERYNVQVYGQNLPFTYQGRFPHEDAPAPAGPAAAR